VLNDTVLLLIVPKLAVTDPVELDCITDIDCTYVFTTLSDTLPFKYAEFDGVNFAKR
jgi:hypothetical protein